MDLNVCPNCNSFVGRDWTKCRTCHHELPPVEEASEASDEGIDTDQAESEATEPSPAPDPVDVTAAPAAPAEAEAANVDNESRLEWPSENRFTPGRVAGTIGAVVLALLVLVAAIVMIVTAEDPEPDVPAPTTTSSIPAVDYVDPAGTFSARFPSTPTRSDLTFEGIAGASHRAIAPDGQTIANVSVTQLPAGGNQQDEEFLRKALTDFSGAAGYKVESSAIIREGDPFKLDATMTNGTQRMNYRTFITNGRLYQLYVQAPNDNQTAPPVFSNLVESFKAT